MHDEIVCELPDVRYAPSFCKNLITIGVLESKCHKASIQDGVQKVVKGAMLVIKEE